MHLTTRAMLQPAVLSDKELRLDSHSVNRYDTKKCETLTFGTIRNDSPVRPAENSRNLQITDRGHKHQKITAWRNLHSETKYSAAKAQMGRAPSKLQCAKKRPSNHAWQPSRTGDDLIGSKCPISRPALSLWTSACEMVADQLIGPGPRIMRQASNAQVGSGPFSVVAVRPRNPLDRLSCHATQPARDDDHFPEGG